MRSRDRRLGMDREISRRDFLNEVSVAIGASESFERNVRDQLGRMPGPGGFDPARDIAGITVNRWH